MAKPKAGMSGPNTAAGRLQRLVLKILKDHEKRGELPTSLRFVFYEGEQLGYWGKGKRQHLDRKTGQMVDTVRRFDTELSEAATVLRENGLIPWDWIVDETRSLTSWSYGDSVEEWMARQVWHYRRNPWDGDPPLILVESRSLYGVLRRIAAEFLCPISSVNGQSSGSLIANDLLNYLRRHPDTPIRYLGDLDLSGGDIESSLKRRIADHLGVDPDDLDWKRIAILPSHVPGLVAKGFSAIAKVDKRFSPVRHYDAWETEALGQGEVQKALRKELLALCPNDLDDVEAKAQREREHFSDHIEAYAPLDLDAEPADEDEDEEDDDSEE